MDIYFTTLIYPSRPIETHSRGRASMSEKSNTKSPQTEALRADEKSATQELRSCTASCFGCRHLGEENPPRQCRVAKYPCGKAEMSFSCPDCLDHFDGCARASRNVMNESVLAYLEIQKAIKQNNVEKRLRKQARAKGLRMAKSILKAKERIASQQKELRKIFYNDDYKTAAFTYTSDRFSKAGELIRKALGAD